MERLKYLHTYNNVIIQCPTYPNARVSGVNPYNEKIMSMPSIIDDINTPARSIKAGVRYTGTYFFFIFNFENYYHFLYDTLPYLYHYFLAL
jgi:hypothetical protein